MVKHQKRSNNDIYKIPLLGFMFKNKFFIRALQLCVLALFFYAIIFGILYPTKEENIFTTAVFWSLFWPLFVVVSLSTFGRVFCGICPHGFMGKYITKFGLKKNMPKALANPFIGVFLLILGFWLVYYVYPQAYKTPFAASILFLVLTFLAVVFFAIYKDMSYCKSICPIGTLMRGFGKISFTTLGTYEESCKNCTTFECATACSSNLKPFTFDKRNSITDCTLCMDCSSACEAVSFKLVPPSQSLFKKFQTQKAEVWAFILITAAITITMSFHHALGRVAIASEYPWVQFGLYLQEAVAINGIDYIGFSALLFAMSSTIFFVYSGMYIASKALKEDFSKVFYTLGYAFAPLFIIGGLSHTYEFFFLEHYSNIANGFMQGFGITGEEVQALATRKDTWTHIFSLLNHVAVIWAFIIMFKRINFFSASKLAKSIAFISASALIFFYLGLNVYKVYAFKTYGTAKSGHNHAQGNKQKFQSVALEKAILLQDGDNKTSGIVCGMNLPMFYKTNHSATLDGKVRQYCSLHCLAEDLFIKKLPLLDIQVVDVETLQFVDASKAFYVLGSRQKGTMSKTSKYAFEKEENANAFVEKYGGKIVSFKEALEVAVKDFAH
ncbi:nitrous oxide reductase accessory protein NosL [bacterium]|nr:nitrous oxide reductase accessory protein NosL [bacterium]MBU1433709.1 nitrous oxide reductase accessory protein NosL [bacterium]MBU1503784.1 nitrous oxide reductase accessory protein NosL [bacterium]